MMHFFKTEIADIYGINAAILLQNILYWCEHNRVNDKHFHDGHYWTYNSMKAFKEQFSYMGDKQIRNALKKLKDEGLILSGNYNKSSYDKTLWYTITEKGYEAFGDSVKSIQPKGRIDESKRAYRVKAKGEPIPDIYSDSVTTNNIINITDNDENVGFDDEIDKYNPFGEGRRPDRNTVYAYASNELVSLSQRAMQEIGDYVNDLSEDVVRHAIDNALDQGVRTWAYVKTILNGYVDAEVHSVGDAKRVDEEYSKKRKGGTKQESTDQSTDKKWQDMTPEEQEYALNHGPFGPWVR